MIISHRLESIAKMVDSVESIIDVGTDHGYLPIYLISKDITNKVIASDINKGPVEKAKYNINKENLQDKIECRLGGGLTTIKTNEVDAVVIAGMGGNLIKDILEESIDLVKKMEYLIFQPVQNPEVLRKYIYENKYEVLDEELCYDEGKYYEIIKVRYNESKIIEFNQEVFYLIGEKLIQKKHPLVKEYIGFRINKYKNILDFIQDTGETSIQRKKQLLYYIEGLKEMLKCL
ncbi:tRNA (adenine(22)-N(1))-methyltransferase [Clostridium grantii]|uniref:tRNA (Adenine22-N1)-methyltransferase n=1 Tax=Clostridium grantii DSM 8605 TaxID=1121316 RepID=A0A1M5QCZ8_9CLOT|nr:class I SAM-dependent methyltransferase [Clostridium grantii]SHH11937.1 tRNA (adenine22-N1)-methyltransferase [Clostridium grantii DSM 8605]